MQYVINLAKHFHSDSLYRNSIYIMLSTAIMSVFGFFFWMIYARMFSSEEIGVVTTILSTTALIGTLSELGLSQGIVRFLPSIENKKELINSVILINLFSAILSIVIFILGVNFFAPKMSFLKTNILYLSVFGFYTLFFAINVPVESIFIVNRKAEFILIKSTIFSIVKFIIPLLFINLGSLGLLLSFAIANIFIVILAFYWLIKIFKHNLAFKINILLIKKIIRFSFINYISGFISQLPILILPIVLTTYIDAKSAAYFYFVIMINNLIKIIPAATTQSLFAEGSNDEKGLKVHAIKAAKIMALILIPVILITIFFGKYVLLAFGKEYSTAGFQFLQILALSNIFTASNYLLGMILKIKGRIYTILFMCIISSSTEILLGYFLLHLGLAGLGYAWLIGEALTCFVFVTIIFFRRK